MNLTNFWNGKMTRQVAEPGSGGTAPEPTPSADLSFIPPDYVVDGKPDLTRFTEHYQGLVAADAQYRERAALVPEDAAYEMTLPEDLKFDGLDLPEDFKVDLSLDDPLYQPIAADLKAFLKDVGAPKEAGKTVAGLIARYEAAKTSKVITALKEDAKTLGTPAQARARAETVARALSNRLPAEQAKALQGMTTSAKALQALEALLGPTAAMKPPVPVPTVRDDLNDFYGTAKR
ncbi:MAG: hypothetical protein JWQ44_2907 [Chthoniobacter sp.]|nr:hypothetical protein [Chthoniobacter sp.]